MSSSDFWQLISESPDSRREREGRRRPRIDSRSGNGASMPWIAADLLTVLVAVAAATLYRFRSGSGLAAWRLIHKASIHGRSTDILLALLLGFTVVLILTSWRLHLYEPTRVKGFLSEQRLSARACFTSGLFLICVLYLLRADDVPRSIVLIALALVTVSLGVRRAAYRILLYRHFDRDLGTRNVLIVGTGQEAQALRHHLDSVRYLGYRFKGFVEEPGSRARRQGEAAATADVVGTLETLFLNVRQYFVDEILFTTRCDRETPGGGAGTSRGSMAWVCAWRLMLCDGLAWNSPIEYIGQFPTIPLHSGHVPELGLLLKRGMDMLSGNGDSAGAFSAAAGHCAGGEAGFARAGVYSSERLGKKGRVFRCIKFRTMVRDADKRRADVMHMNERDGVLFKISNDPRITAWAVFCASTLWTSCRSSSMCCAAT